MVVRITAIDGGSWHVQQLMPFGSMQKHLSMSTHSWLGMLGDEIVCVWGLIPPSIMSDQAYLWLHVTQKLKGHEFLFIRHSQRMIERMLEDFPVIVGFVEVGNEKAKRWIGWLGAEFGFPSGNKIPFEIRRK